MYLPSRSFGAATIIEYKQKALVTQEIRKPKKPKTQTLRWQSWKFYFEINFWRLCGDMMQFGGYSIGIAQIDDKI